MLDQALIVFLYALVTLDVEERDFGVESFVQGSV